MLNKRLNVEEAFLARGAQQKLRNSGLKTVC